MTATLVLDEVYRLQIYSTLDKCRATVSNDCRVVSQGFVKGESAVRKVIVACPTSLVGNWDREIKRWVGERCITFPVKSEPKIIIKHFLQVCSFVRVL